MYILELNNRLNWPKTILLPSEYACKMLGLNYKTYKKYLNFLIENKFIFEIEKAKNQFTATQIALEKFTKVMLNLVPKHVPKQYQSTFQSNTDIIRHNRLIDFETNNSKIDFHLDIHRSVLDKELTEEQINERKNKFIKMLESNEFLKLNYDVLNKIDEYEFLKCYRTFKKKYYEFLKQS